MPGSRKGERRGGRQKGTPNRLASTRVERVEREGRKLPPEELLRNAEDCRWLAEYYSPRRMNPETGAVEQNPHHNLSEYKDLLAMERESLKAAAPYYAPRLMAMAVQANLVVEEEERGDDPRQVMWEIYRTMRERGELGLKALAPPARANGGDRQSVTIEAKAKEEDDGDGVAT